MIIAKEHEKNIMFEKNLSLLTPWLKESVLQISDEELHQKVEITYNEEGYPICRYHEKDKTFRINSIRPLDEAKRWYKGIPQKGTGVIFLFGSGFGYPLFEIFERKQPHTLVVVFEEDLYLFKAMLYYFDLEPIIKTNKISFMVGDSKFFANAFEDLFFSIFFVGCTYPTIAFSNAAIHNFKEKYIKLFNYVFSQLSLFVFYVGNDHQDNLIGYCNIVGNIKEIIENPYISCLKDKYQNIPAFIVANGPSLDKNIDYLQEIQGRGLIICVESAIIPLLKNKIKPDILAVIERTKNSYTYHFQNIDYPEDITLLCLALVDKNILPSFPGARIPIFREKEVINKWINGFLGDGSSIDAGANVSHLATELAVHLGANPIIFVGQDYAYGPGKVTHSGDSLYSNEAGKKARENIQAMPTVYLEGNDGTMIPSNQVWTDFKMGLERKIAVHSKKSFINATEGGAKLAGTKCQSLQSVIKDYCLMPLPYRVNDIISKVKSEISIPQRKERLEALIASIEEYSHLFRDLADQAIKGKLECREMLRLSREKDQPDHQNILEKAYQNNLEIINRFLAKGLYRSFTQQAIFANYYFLNRMGMIDNPQKINEVFNIQYDLFCHLNAICQSVSVHFEDSLITLNKLLNDIVEEKV